MPFPRPSFGSSLASAPSLFCLHAVSLCLRRPSVDEAPPPPGIKRQSSLPPLSVAWVVGDLTRAEQTGSSMWSHAVCSDDPPGCVLQKDCSADLGALDDGAPFPFPRSPIKAEHFQELR